MLQKCNKIGDVLNEVGWWRLLSRGTPHEVPPHLIEEIRVKNRGLKKGESKKGAALWSIKGAATPSLLHRLVFCL